MDNSQISVHEIRAYLAFKENKNSWFTSKELAEKAHIAERTSRLYVREFAEQGTVELMKVFPGYRYKFAKTSQVHEDVATKINVLEG